MSWYFSAKAKLNLFTSVWVIEANTYQVDESMTSPGRDTNLSQVSAKKLLRSFKKLMKNARVANWTNCYFSSQKSIYSAYFNANISVFRKQVKLLRGISSVLISFTIAVADCLYSNVRCSLLEPGGGCGRRIPYGRVTTHVPGHAVQKVSLCCFQECILGTTAALL